ncbi:MAG: cytochrome c556 [Candidatus Azotimanducaceae bacterium]|jgi:cytochrome c556
MNESRLFNRLISIVGLVTVSIGGPSLLAADSMRETTIADVVDTRQQGFKEMGRAMKVFRTELRSDSPDSNAMMVAAKTVASHADEISGWFPAGSGPESGLETDALPYIWKNTEKFSRLSREIVPASVALVAAVATKDTATIVSGVSATGKTCKGCHDSFRDD